MDFCRLHRIKHNTAFTLAEVICSAAIVAVAALFVMYAALSAGNYYRKAVDLQNEADLAASELYGGMGKASMIYPVAVINGEVETVEISVNKYEILDGRIVMYYYGGSENL